MTGRQHTDDAGGSERDSPTWTSAGSPTMGSVTSSSMENTL
jgi:hypothetical protein